MSEDLDIFLRPAPGIQCDHPEVAALARRIAGHAQDQAQAARLLFNEVRDRVRYHPWSPFDRLEDYLALATLARGRGYCVQKSALLVALARSLGIPARLGFAHILNHQLPAGMKDVLGSDVMDHHCLAEWRLNGRWLRATPSFEAPLCARRGWRLVEFSESADALLPAHDLQGRPHITYLQHLGWRAGVPLEEIIAGWSARYGGERVAAWSQGRWEARPG